MTYRSFKNFDHLTVLEDISKTELSELKSHTQDHNGSLTQSIHYSKNIKINVIAMIKQRRILSAK